MKGSEKIELQKSQSSSVVRILDIMRDKDS